MNQHVLAHITGLTKCVSQGWQLLPCDNDTSPCQTCSEASHANLQNTLKVSTHDSGCLRCTSAGGKSAISLL